MQRRAEDAPVERRSSSLLGAPASRRATVSSNRPNRSFAASAAADGERHLHAGDAGVAARATRTAADPGTPRRRPSSPACSSTSRGRSADARRSARPRAWARAPRFPSCRASRRDRRSPCAATTTGAPLSGAACAVQRQSPAASFCGKSAWRFAYCAALRRVELLQARAERGGNERDVARIGLDVRIARRVHVALRAVELCRHLELAPPLDGARHEPPPRHRRARLRAGTARACTSTPCSSRGWSSRSSRGCTSRLTTTGAGGATRHRRADRGRRAGHGRRLREPLGDASSSPRRHRVMDGVTAQLTPGQGDLRARPVRRCSATRQFGQRTRRIG